MISITTDAPTLSHHASTLASTIESNWNVLKDGLFGDWPLDCGRQGEEFSRTADAALESFRRIRVSMLEAWGRGEGLDLDDIDGARRRVEACLLEFRRIWPCERDSAKFGRRTTRGRLVLS